MKRIKMIASIITAIALSLCLWSVYELLSENGNIIAASLNLIYFFTLLIAFLCIRIAMGVSQKIEAVPTLLSVVVIISSTYAWFNSSELLVAGKYTLGILPVLIGTTLMLVVKSDSKWSKLTQLGIGFISISMAVCVFTGAFGTSIYTILFFGMIALSLAVIGYSLFAKTT